MCSDHDKLPPSFLLTEEFCGSVRDLAAGGFTKERIDRLWLAINKSAKAAPSTRYVNLVDGKIYDVIAETDGLVSYALAHGGAPHYLGRPEFEKRFKVIQAPTPSAHVSGEPARSWHATGPLAAHIVEWRNKHGKPDGTQYEQGQWDMAQRVIMYLIPPTAITEGSAE